MSGLVKWAIKGAAYYFIVFPVVMGILQSFLGWGFGSFLGFIAATGLAIWLEKTGKSNQILARVFGGAKQSAAGGSVADIFDPTPAPKGIETTAKCPNCSSNITLINGHGKCEACDHAM